MSLYDIDWGNIIDNLLPPDKRTPVTRAFMRAFTKQVAVDAYVYFNQYKLGSTDAQWMPNTIYNRRDVVIYMGAVYQSKCNNNANTPTGNGWRLIAPSFIGKDTRLAFRCQKIIAEYALNLRFNTAFRQPPLISDIYITSNEISNDVFVIGATEANSSVVYSKRSSAFIINAYTFEIQYGYTINIPTAVYNGLGSAKQSIVEAFANLFTAAGILYNIQPY